MASASEAAKLGESYFPLGGTTLPNNQATATCYCGAVQLTFPVEGEGLVDPHVCNCTDCRKVTGSMFASNFGIRNTHLSHVRGEDKLSRFTMTRTIGTGNAMTSSFCSICGSLMYRASSGFPDLKFLRIGTVDDFNLHETKLRPRIEQFTKDRVGWLSGVQGEDVHRSTGFYFA